jgi:hypothetical protein
MSRGISDQRVRAIAAGIPAACTVGGKERNNLTAEAVRVITARVSVRRQPSEASAAACDERVISEWVSVYAGHKCLLEGAQP